MSVILIDPENDAEAHAIEYLSPVVRGLRVIHFVNTDTKKVSWNYAPEGPVSELLGTPELIEPGFARFKPGLSGVLTGMPEPEYGTFFIAARTLDDLSAGTPPVGSRPCFFGTFRSPDVIAPDVNINGIVFFSSSGGIPTAGAVFDDAGVASYVSVNIPPKTQLTTWALYSLTISPDGVELRNETEGLSAHRAVALPRRRSSGRVHFGTLPDVSLTQGRPDIAAFQAHDVALSAPERALVAEDLRRYLAGRNISV